MMRRKPVLTTVPNLAISKERQSGNASIGYHADCNARFPADWYVGYLGRADSGWMCIVSD